MASHRKPRVGQFAGIDNRVSARVALTLATATAATVGVLAHPVQAETRLSADEVKTRLDALYAQAETATQEYDGAVAQAAELQLQAAQLQQQAARTDAATEGLRARLGALAAAQYRDGGMERTLVLLTTAHPDDYLRLAGSLSQVSSAQQQILDQYARQQTALRRQQTAVASRLAALQAEQQRIAAARTRIQAELAAAQQLLDSLDADRRASVQHAESGAGGSSGSAGSTAGGGSGSTAPTAGRADVPVSDVPVSDVPGSGRAAAVVAFARAQLGKPYVWGAAGPGSFDCSGLAQAAWRAAGVSLPRTTYEQVNAGRRIPVSQLQPGDLVFYYSGVTHVGIYVGGGRIIHAPHPGASVEYAPVGEMPISGTVRPA